MCREPRAATLRAGRSIDRSSQVVYPTGDCTKHYFNARYWITPSEGRGWEIGLPFSYRSTSAGRYLSSEVWSGNNGAKSCAGTKLRSTYLEFAHDQLPGSSTLGQPGFTARNRRVKASRTVFHDDGDRWVDTAFSDFDGLGHYRLAVTTGDLWEGSASNEQRTVTTNYNRVTGTYGQGGYAPPAVSDPWVLNVFDKVTTYEPDAVGQSFSTVEYTFDMDTGFLDCTRILELAETRSADDLLIRNLHDNLGLLTEVKRYGGNLQTLPTGSACPVELGAPEYWTQHTYENGVRKTTRPYEPDGTPGPFLTYDVDLDPSTGLVTTRRDPAGFGTTYTHDVSGRVTRVTPDEGAEMTYNYVNPTATEGAKIEIHAVSGTTALTSSWVYFDDFGRVWQEHRKMPDGSWSDRETLYNARGWRKSISEWGDLTKTTQFLEFDPFGRATKIRPPDGSAHDLLFDFDGVRKVVSQAKINLSAGETYVPTTREYDAYGRLRKVLENSSGTGTDTPTTYDYDVGGRLTQITSGTVALGGVQTRSFDYDNRGFMLSETHPEKGATGNGTVFNYDFDSRGLVHRNLDGPNDLDFEYDFMGRLTAVRDKVQGNRLVTELLYDSGLGYGTGKLWKATQHNWIDWPWNAPGEEDVTVVETYAYQGQGGAISKRTTSTNLDLDSQSTGETQDFELSYVYDDLGNVSQIAYPSCLHGSCTATVGAGQTVDYLYGEGLLTEVVGWTSATTPIAYHPNGAFSSIPHANGVTDHQLVDPDITGRPSQLYTDGATLPGTSDDADWDSGVFSYDGAGNISSMVRAGMTNTFVYDEVSRLVDATTEGWQETYEYDIFGNIEVVETTPPGGSPSTVIFSVDASTNRITGAISYDAAGNLSAWGFNSYAWDSMNRLEEMNDRWFHVYSAAGERVATVDWQGAVSSREVSFTLRGLGNQVLARFELAGEDQSGNWSRDRDYVYAGARLLASDDGAGGGALHYHLDHLGTPRLLTDAAGDEASRHHYLPYGEETTAPGADVMKFTGHERDLDAGQDYMHARYYQEHLGRFLSVDFLLGYAPVPQSHNRYAYAWSRPVVLVDLDGRSPAPFALAFYGAAAGAAGLVAGIGAEFAHGAGHHGLEGGLNILAGVAAFAGGVVAITGLAATAPVWATALGLAAIGGSVFLFIKGADAFSDTHTTGSVYDIFFPPTAPEPPPKPPGGDDEDPEPPVGPTITLPNEPPPGFTRPGLGRREGPASGGRFFFGTGWAPSGSTNGFPGGGGGAVRLGTGSALVCWPTNTAIGQEEGVCQETISAVF